MTTTQIPTTQSGWAAERAAVALSLAALAAITVGAIIDADHLAETITDGGVVLAAAVVVGIVAACAINAVVFGCTRPSDFALVILGAIALDLCGWMLLHGQVAAIVAAALLVATALSRGLGVMLRA